MELPVRTSVVSDFWHLCVVCHFVPSPGLVLALHHVGLSPAFAPFPSGGSSAVWRILGGLVVGAGMAKGQPIFHALVTQDALAPTAWPVVIEVASAVEAESLRQRLPDGIHQGVMWPIGVLKDALSCFDQAQPHTWGRSLKLGGWPAGNPEFSSSIIASYMPLTSLVLNTDSTYSGSSNISWAVL